MCGCFCSSCVLLCCSCCCCCYCYFVVVVAVVVAAVVIWCPRQRRFFHCFIFVVFVYKHWTILLYFRGLSECNSGSFDRIVSTYTELASHEKVLDDLISLLRKGQVCLNSSHLGWVACGGGQQIFVMFTLWLPSCVTCKCFLVAQSSEQAWKTKEGNILSKHRENWCHPTILHLTWRNSRGIQK